LSSAYKNKNIKNTNSSNGVEIDLAAVQNIKTEKFYTSANYIYPKNITNFQKLILNKKHNLKYNKIHLSGSKNSN
jgi:hypothetical protein